MITDYINYVYQCFVKKINTTKIQYKLRYISIKIQYKLFNWLKRIYFVEGRQISIKEEKLIREENLIFNKICNCICSSLDMVTQ